MKNPVVILIVICCGSFFSCSKNDPVSTGSDLSLINLSVGSVNTYAYVVLEDSSGTATETYRDTFAVRVEAANETIGEYSGLYKIKAYDVGNDSLYEYEWYKQSAAELIDVAYQCAGRVPVIIPKRGSKGNIFSYNTNAGPIGLQILAGRFNMVQDTIVRTDLRIVYRYPLSAGASWTSFSNPFLQTREVQGKEAVTLPAGVYVCTKIRTRMPNDAPAMDWYDYVSDKGLIVRTISDSMAITTVDNPDAVGTKKKITYRLQLIQRTL